MFTPIRYLLLSLLSLMLPISAASADSCPMPTVDSALNLTIPCVGVNGQQYAVELTHIEDTEGDKYWRLHSISESSCDWKINSCATVDEILQVTIPSLSWEGVDSTVKLRNYLPSNATPTDLFWKYVEHAPTKTLLGETDNPGTLHPYHVSAPVTGTGRKLLAIYMVGSNLESGASQAATSDLFELVGGYRQLTDPKIDIIVAFGGSTKDHWPGMKFANIMQLLEDANDARFGNNQDYLYRSDTANMGDISSLKHFLNYLRESHLNYDQQFLVFWDHGASYRGFGNDEFYNMKPLSLPDIQQALADSQQHFNLLGFDACLMASLETAKYTHQYADYLLASEDLEPGHGWNWTDVLLAYADYDDIIARGKTIIDHYIKDSSHAYKSSGKTLSLADLSVFPEVEAALLPILKWLASNLTANETPIVTTLSESLQNVRGYSNSHNISLDLKDFLVQLESLTHDFTIDPVLKDQFTILLETLNRYLIYSRHDGSRPYSYGTSLDRFDNEPYKVSLHDSLSNLQQTWKTFMSHDQEPPQQVDSSLDVQITGISNVTAEELKLLRDYIEGGTLTAENLPWWEMAYEIMADPQTTLGEKLTIIAALENDSSKSFNGDIIRQYYLKKVEILRVEILRGVEISRGVELLRNRQINTRSAPRSTVDFIAKPLAFTPGTRQNTERTRQTADLPIPAERVAFTAIRSNNPLPETSRSAIILPLTGSVSSFADQTNLTLTAVYGTIYQNPDTGHAQDFDSFAELEVFPTQEAGSYFTYAWNRMWYTIKYSPEQSSLWIPLRFSEHFWKEGTVYTVYTGEIHYRNWQFHYPTPASDEEAEILCTAKGLIAKNQRCYQRAVLELQVDPNNSVVAHYVRPYQIIEQQTLFDKETFSLAVGDEVWFLFDSFGLTPGSSPIQLANTFSAPVVFTQHPVFAVEMMTAVSATTLKPKKFYYAMRATDSAGNITIGDLFPAKTPMPPCAKLEETDETFKEIVTNLLKTPSITFISPLGEALDQAMSTMMVIAEAEEKPPILEEVDKLYEALYNKNTLDLESSDWVWETVDWHQVKLGIENMSPILENITQRECNLDKSLT